ncbi:hypothetical protein THASP1DRAFT_32582 [Thamnocephalis sphaerospora]|uniref:DNA-binding protein RAP1 n=1 Tax=Thamnocephalis sphaerospora TaxID=78915 RepID=A0A4V1IVX5_9FUNG|nr:hypothetical protein THASP1DRAFT_32582 [Thamnocephalis sphaerospora]|eukprot:RKP05579.1 hypothetical protein THASP1DRAFT_32582 [Thamnocephalis sphaerospora]
MSACSREPKQLFTFADGRSLGFYAERGPGYTHMKNVLEAHGGKIIEDRRLAYMTLVAPYWQHTLGHAYSYRYILESAKSGRLLCSSSFYVPQHGQTTVEDTSYHAMTVGHDEIILFYLTQPGVERRNRDIYRKIAHEASYPAFPWQSWRRRYMRMLRRNSYFVWRMHDIIAKKTMRIAEGDQGYSASNSTLHSSGHGLDHAAAEEASDSANDEYDTDGTVSVDSSTISRLADQAKNSSLGPSLDPFLLTLEANPKKNSSNLPPTNFESHSSANDPHSSILQRGAPAASSAASEQPGPDRPTPLSSLDETGSTRELDTTDEQSTARSESQEYSLPGKAAQKTIPRSESSQAQQSPPVAVQLTGLVKQETDDHPPCAMTPLRKCGVQPSAANSESTAKDNAFESSYGDSAIAPTRSIAKLRAGSDRTKSRLLASRRTTNKVASTSYVAPGGTKTQENEEKQKAEADDFFANLPPESPFNFRRRVPTSNPRRDDRPVVLDPEWETVIHEENVAAGDKESGHHQGQQTLPPNGKSPAVNDGLEVCSPPTNWALDTTVNCSFAHVGMTSSPRPPPTLPSDEKSAAQPHATAQVEASGSGGASAMSTPQSARHAIRVETDEDTVHLHQADGTAPATTSMVDTPRDNAKVRAKLSRRVSFAGLSPLDDDDDNDEDSDGGGPRRVFGRTAKRMRLPAGNTSVLMPDSDSDSDNGDPGNDVGDYGGLHLAGSSMDQSRAGYTDAELTVVLGEHPLHLTGLQSGEADLSVATDAARVLSDEQRLEFLRLVKQLRDEAGVSGHDVFRALEVCSGNVPQARELLRKGEAHCAPFVWTSEEDAILCSGTDADAIRDLQYRRGTRSVQDRIAFLAQYRS